MAIEIPQYHELMWPALEAIRALGGSSTIQEMDEWVIEREGFPEEVQAVSHGDGRQTEVEYRLAWARTHLKGIGAIENSSRGVWALTDRGRAITEDKVREDTKAWRAEIMRRRHERLKAKGDEGDIEETDDDEDWRDRLIRRLLELDPAAFERLCQRLLREAGFVNVTVMGRSGDGGIDGVGVYRLSLVSFPTYFQAKRYKGSVAAHVVRDFRGAMAGRGDKGLLITTGSYTRDAVAESSRDGAPPIELIDGDRLADLLKEYGLGVSTRMVEEVEVHEDFFDDI